MTKRATLVFFILGLFLGPLVAQEQNSCQQESYMEYLDLKFIQNKENREKAEAKVQLNQPVKNTVINMPIKAYIVRTSAGTGGIALCDLQEALDTANVQYLPSMYNLYICSLEYIDSDAYYNIGSFTEGDNLYYSNNDPGAINMYFVDVAAGYCGWANFPTDPNRYILMQNGCTMNTSTFAHELGHYFGLYHTHQGGNELVNGSNCTSAGDLLCDTPAEPSLSGLVTSGCVYTGSSTDSNGDTYVPDPLNMMSYSQKHCRDYFSPDQVARMDFFYANYRAAQFNCGGTVSLCCVSDSDGDGICDDVDQCPGQNDNLIGTACSDGDPCTSGELYDNTCSCTGGVSADSDGDGVCDALDICPGFDDSIDSDNDGIPDGCDLNCTQQSANFNTNPLTHSGGGSSSSSHTFVATSQLITFDVIGISQKLNGNPNNRYIEQVTVSYVDQNGATQTYGTYSGANTSSVSVSITGVAQSISISLEDIYDGSSNQTMTVNMSAIDFCGTPCSDSDNDGVCDAVDVCPGFDDNLDADNDGIPDGCDNCTNVNNSFSSSPLTHSGGGSSSSTATLSSAVDPSFTVSALGSKENGNPNNRYIDQVDISYQDSNGSTFALGPYYGNQQNSVSVNLTGTINSVTVTLSDAYDGSANSLSVNLTDVTSCAGGGADEIESTQSPFAEDIVVYPIPTRDILFVKGLKASSVVSLYSIDGQLMMQQKLSKEGNINVSNFNSGFYYLVFTTADKRIAKKVIIE